MRIRGGAVPRRRRARALGPGRLRDRRAIRRAVSVRRSARAGMPASPRTVRRGHVVEPVVGDAPSAAVRPCERYPAAGAGSWGLGAIEPPRPMRPPDNPLRRSSPATDAPPQP